MKPLNLPEYSFKITDSEGMQKIFDCIRKKYIALTPEEWVRQNFVQFLIHEKKIPVSLIAVEMQLRYHKLVKRCDVIVYDNTPKPLLIVECKAPEIEITQKVFDQIARYNFNLNVKYLVVTNGINHYYCIIDDQEKKYSFLKELPEYSKL